MILATNKCGCPPKKEKPPCSPCCASKRVTIKSATSSEISCARIDEPPPCCPIKPSDDAYQRPSKLRSEIADKGLPYKEIEAIINNNKLVIRTQTEPGRPEFDPPCDCNEEGLPVRQIEPDETQHQSAGNRTVTLFPRPQDEDKPELQYGDDDRDLLEKRMTIERVENPNIFLLRMRKQSVVGDKRYNIDVEFKTPRPWSTKKRLEYIEKHIQPMQSTESTKKKDNEEQKPKELSKKSKKRKRR